MRPSFHPRMVNGPFGDPGIFIPLTFQRQAILFDLGDVSALSPGDLLKTSHIFVSHTHMDHFIGFDHVLRLLLGRDKAIHLYGPCGFLENVRAKLSGYTWNLVQGYQASITLIAHEVQTNSITTQTYRCKSGFEPTEPETHTWTPPVLHKEPLFQVKTAILDHRTPCLGFCIEEHFHVNILKTKLTELGLALGPWINNFKTQLFAAADPNMEIIAPGVDPETTPQRFALGALADRIARITPGQKIAYITDASFTQANEEKMVALAMDADHLFIEATFLEKHLDLARAKCHLTARQAGAIARKARAKQITIFHHSPRYTDQKQLLEEEALKAFSRSY